MDCTAGIVVVASAAEAPGVGCEISGVGMSGARKVKAAREVLALDAGCRARRRRRVAVISVVVGGDADARGHRRFGDAVAHCTAGVIIVAGRVIERPGITGIGSSVGVRGAREVKTAGEVLAL